MPVDAIGGIFFRSKDPDGLEKWYRDHLNVGAGCAAGDEAPSDAVWTTLGGPVVFAPFSADSDYFPAEKSFMLNLRVSQIDELLARLREAGIDVVTKPEWNDPTIGRFARIHDPEGNPVELWEPPS